MAPLSRFYAERSFQTECDEQVSHLAAGPDEVKSKNWTRS